MREVKLSLHELGVLVSMQGCGPTATVAMGELRALLGLAPAGMSVLCRGLEDRGLVQIVSSTHDRRTKMLRLTVAGLELCLKVQWILS